MAKKNTFKNIRTLSDVKGAVEQSWVQEELLEQVKKFSEDFYKDKKERDKQAQEKRKPRKPKKEKEPKPKPEPEKETREKPKKKPREKSAKEKLEEFESKKYEPYIIQEKLTEEQKRIIHEDATFEKALRETDVTNQAKYDEMIQYFDSRVDDIIEETKNSRISNLLFQKKRVADLIAYLNNDEKLFNEESKKYLTAKLSAIQAGLQKSTSIKQRAISKAGGLIKGAASSLPALAIALTGGDPLAAMAVAGIASGVKKFSDWRRGRKEAKAADKKILEKMGESSTALAELKSVKQTYETNYNTERETLLKKAEEEAAQQQAEPQKEPEKEKKKRTPKQEPEKSFMSSMLEGSGETFSEGVAYHEMTGYMRQEINVLEQLAIPVNEIADDMKQLIEVEKSSNDYLRRISEYFTGKKQDEQVAAFEDNESPGLGKLLKEEKSKGKKKASFLSRLFGGGEGGGSLLETFALAGMASNLLGVPGKMLGGAGKMLGGAGKMLGGVGRLLKLIPGASAILAFGLPVAAFGAAAIVGHELVKSTGFAGGWAILKRTILNNLLGTPEQQLAQKKDRLKYEQESLEKALEYEKKNGPGTRFGRNSLTAIGTDALAISEAEQRKKIMELQSEVLKLEIDAINESRKSRLETATVGSTVSAALGYSNKPMTLGGKYRGTAKQATPIHPDIDKLIVKYSDQYKIDPNILRGLVMQESSGNPYAKAKGSSAKGLTQMIDSTAREMGVTDPYDPEQSIKGGAKYLRIMYDNFGTTEEALQHYFAGPSKRSPYLAGGAEYAQNVLRKAEAYRKAEQLSPANNIPEAVKKTDELYTKRDELAGTQQQFTPINNTTMTPAGFPVAPSTAGLNEIPSRGQVHSAESSFQMALNMTYMNASG